MNTLLGGAPAPGFDVPLEMQLACHSRIEAQCDTLNRLVEYLRTHGNNAQASQAARAILRYFDAAVQHHPQDEELDLFPRLRATQDHSANKLVARLLLEHERMEAARQCLRPLLIDIAEDKSDRLDLGTSTHFIDLYARHIALENVELLPLTNKLLNREVLQSLGSNMAGRCGVTI